MQEVEHRQGLVAKGARMEALDSAADEILKAAKQLEHQVRRETKYWQEIVSVSDKGWPIQRSSHNKRHAPFSVRYGLPEGMTPSRIRIMPLVTKYSQQIPISRLAALLLFRWTRTAASYSTQNLHLNQRFSVSESVLTETSSEHHSMQLNMIRKLPHWRSPSNWHGIRYWRRSCIMK